MLFSAEALKKRFCEELSLRGWRQPQSSWSTSSQTTEQRLQLENPGTAPIASFNLPVLFQERIGVEAQFGTNPVAPFDLLARHMAFYVGDVIDVGVEVLPMKEMSVQMSSGISYYEGELYNVIRQGRGVPAVPLVLLGVAP
jgi:hypothetical protein